MKKIFFLTIVTLLIISCNENYRKATTDNSEQTQVEENEKSVSVADLISLYENISNPNYINNKLESLDFKKKFNGVYISKKHISTNEPKHWVHIYDIGDISSVSFSTAEKEIWDKFLIEIKKYGDPIPFDDGTSSKAIRYIGEKYTFETYEPRNGVNLSMNELYQIIILKTKE
ncbi:MAG: hypothetical protein WBH98_09645 [Bacteroidales bacterium]